MNARADWLEANELRPVAGYEGIYSVSADGRIWTHRRKIESQTKDGFPYRITVGGRWLKNHKSSSYMQVVLCVDGKKSMPMVHRLVAAAFVENPHGYPEVNHKDGNKHNNHADNLEWVTRSMNNKHAWDTGLQKVTPARLAHGSDLHHKYTPLRNK